MSFNVEMSNEVETFICFITYKFAQENFVFMSKKGLKSLPKYEILEEQLYHFSSKMKEGWL